MAWNKEKNTPEQLRAYYKKYYAQKRKQKLQEEREKNPTYKICPMCSTKFVAKSNQKYCCEACRKLGAKVKSKILHNTEEYKEKGKQYRQTEAYKKAQAKYKESEKYKKYREEYNNSEKAKESRKRYLESEKGKATLQRYYDKVKANGWKPLSQKETEKKPEKKTTKKATKKK